jgi:hypothetical protein
MEKKDGFSKKILSQTMARVRISLFENVRRVARASSPAGSRTVPVREPATGGETPPQPAGEDACATVFSARLQLGHQPFIA